MKKLLIVIILFFYQNNSFSDDIVYLDIQYIIDNSNIGKFYKNKIKKIQDNYNIDSKSKEEEIKNSRNKLNDQKNILSQSEYKKKLSEFNELVNNYKKNRITLNNNIIDEKKKYTSKILTILNPLLTNYVDENKIKLVVDKKNVLVGTKKLDITPNILEILNNEVKNKNLTDEN